MHSRFRATPAFWQLRGLGDAGFAHVWNSSGLGPALVAITWFWVFGTAIPVFLRTQLAVALFVVVGLIYFLDRVWDRRTPALARINHKLRRDSSPTKSQPASRKSQQMACDLCGLAHPGVNAPAKGLPIAPFKIFVVLALVFATGALLPGLLPKEGRLVGAVFECASATVAYYLAKRLWGCWNGWRSLVVAWIFWRGVTGPGLAWSQTLPGPAEISLLFLFIANAAFCLRAFSLVWNSTPFWVVWTGLSLMLWWVAGTEGTHIAIIGSASTILLGLVGIFVHRLAHVKVVVFADMALWLPPFLYILWQATSPF